MTASEARPSISSAPSSTSPSPRLFSLTVEYKWWKFFPSHGFVTHNRLDGAGEKVVSNFTRVVMIIWVFVVLILTSSYTASLTSMLTVQQLHPTVTNLHELIRNGEYIGCMGDPSMLGMLNIDRSKLKVYQTDEEYDEALTKGSSRGGVGAIIDEIPYIKVFLSKYCGKYTMVGNIYRTDGFGFVSTSPSFS